MILNNNKDPLADGPNAGRVLLERLGAVCNGFPHMVVIDAASNLLINVIRHAVPKRIRALTFFDELFGRAKSALDAHYDKVTGDRRNIFAHTQHVVMDTHKDPEGL